MKISIVYIQYTNIIQQLKSKSNQLEQLKLSTATNKALLLFDGDGMMDNVCYFLHAQVLLKAFRMN